MDHLKHKTPNVEAFQVVHPKGKTLGWVFIVCENVFEAKTARAAYVLARAAFPKVR